MLNPQIKDLLCPECGSSRIIRDGLRYLPSGVSVQRFICKDCTYRFSDPKGSRDCLTYSNGSQVCVILQEAKNLTSATESKNVAGERVFDDKTKEFAWRQQRDGLRESTIRNRINGLRRLSSLGADLEQPSSVDTILVSVKFTESVKRELVRGYYAFCQSFDIKWKKPKTHYEPREIYLPKESEIDTLIAGCGRRTACLLAVLKDTGARISEAVKIEWNEVSDNDRTIAINKPSKGSRSRIVKVSEKTIAMIKAMPHKYDPFIFSPNVGALRDSFYLSRRKIAEKLQQPDLSKIHFHSLRHWRGTKESRVTHGELRRVQYLLGHKNPQNTARYDHNEDFLNDEWIVKRPLTAKDEDELVSTGFEFVRYDESEGCPIYKKRA